MTLSNAGALPLLFALAAASVSSIEARAELQGNARLSGSVGVDSNARRDFQQVGAQVDGVLSAVGSGQARWLLPWSLLSGSYDLGVRKFLTLSAEDFLVQSATLGASIPIVKLFDVGVEGWGKDRRGGPRGYTDLVGAGFLELAPTSALTIRVRGAFHRFIYHPFFPYSFSAGEGSGRLQYRIDRYHSLSLFGDLSFRSYNAIADSDPNGPPPERPVQRSDRVTIGGLSYRYGGPVLVSVGYTYGDFSSNSFGQTAHRHRLAASAGVRLPWKWTLLAEGVLQFTNYPDKIFAAPQILLIDDENLNSISLKLARPLSSDLDLELQYAFYHASLPGPDATYRYVRMVGGIGMTWRLW